MAMYLLAHLFAFVLAGGVAVGDAAAKKPADQTPPPAAAGDSRLEQAARDYRIQTYEAFHNDRAEYDRRRAEGARVEAAWTDAGRNDAEQPLLIHWFDQAAASSRTDSIADLPSAPKFTPMPQKKEPEKKLVESAPAAASVEDAAATIDSLLHVKPVASTTAAPDTAPITPPDVVSPSSWTPTEPPANGAANPAPIVKPALTNPESAATPAAPQYKPSTIGSLPKSLGAEIGRTLHEMSGK